jgi:hypothetical protein
VSAGFAYHETPSFPAPEAWKESEASTESSRRVESAHTPSPFGHIPSEAAPEQRASQDVDERPSSPYARRIAELEARLRAATDAREEEHHKATIREADLQRRETAMAARLGELERMVCRQRAAAADTQDGLGTDSDGSDSELDESEFFEELSTRVHRGPTGRASRQPAIPALPTALLGELKTGLEPGTVASWQVFSESQLFKHAKLLKDYLQQPETLFFARRSAIKQLELEDEYMAGTLTSVLDSKSLHVANFKSMITRVTTSERKSSESKPAIMDSGYRMWRLIRASRCSATRRWARSASPPSASRSLPSTSRRLNVRLATSRRP